MQIEAPANDLGQFGAVDVIGHEVLALVEHGQTSLVREALDDDGHLVGMMLANLLDVVLPLVKRAARLERPIGG